MRIIIILFLITLTTDGFTQNLNFNELQTQERPKREKYTSYTTQNGVTINIGDTIVFGEPSIGKTYNYIQRMDSDEILPFPISLNELTISRKGLVAIIGFKKSKDKTNFYPIIISQERKKDFFPDFQDYIQIEDALKSKEVLLK
jgi:hypothetical protein